MSAGTRYRQAQLASAFQDHAKKHSDRWVEAQERMLKQWRELVEERSKDDDRLFRDWSKSWMATSFKLLEMQRETMAQATRAQLEAIDDYLEQLGKHHAQDADAGASSNSKSTKATSK